MTHPLDDDAAALRGAGFLALVRTHAGGPAWHPCAGLVAGPEPLQAWTDRVTGWLRATYRAEPPAVVAPTYLMGWYLDAVARAGATWVVLRGRLPSLAPSDLALHETPGGWPDAVAVTGHDFTCLPGDPAAQHPGATTVPDAGTLLAALDTAVRAHASAFHDAFAPAVKIGGRQRWGMVDDVLEAGLWAARGLAGGHPPRPGTRRSCCFAYQVDPALLCERCPRRLAPSR